MTDWEWLRELEERATLAGQGNNLINGQWYEIDIKRLLNAVKELKKALEFYAAKGAPKAQEILEELEK